MRCLILISIGREDRDSVGDGRSLALFVFDARPGQHRASLHRCTLFVVAGLLLVGSCSVSGVVSALQWSRPLPPNARAQERKGDFQLPQTIEKEGSNPCHRGWQPNQRREFKRLCPASAAVNYGEGEAAGRACRTSMPPQTEVGSPSVSCSPAPLWLMVAGLLRWFHVSMLCQTPRVPVAPVYAVSDSAPLAGGRTGI